MEKRNPQDESKYDETYQEKQVIGRGNFGAAMLVIHKKEGTQYIAKKVNLSGLSEKEQQGCMLEVNLLKNLEHPNIVAYKESFLTSNQLIIVMEYCEVGDLAYHIKRKQTKGEVFTELEVFNWVVQIALSLEYVHARRVIHRDIKTQNVFLTGNNTVKIGDFGISKVLETTCQNANTVVGTPYYMAPEACQSEPYTSKSDVWALGCILYELCTLKKPFEADNLLGLVFKIVTDDPPPIDTNLPYSKELRALIDQLLTKDPKNRPSIADFLHMPTVKKMMADYVATKGQTLKGSSKVFNKQIPKIEQKKEQDPTNETPKERMAREKREKADAKFQQMSNAAKGQLQENAMNKQAIHAAYHGGAQGQPAKSVAQNFYKPQEQMYEKSNPNSRTTGGKPVNDGFFNPVDDRPIQGGNDDMYDDLSDICLVDDLQETTKAADDNLLLSKIVMAYEQILSDKELQSQQVLKNELTEAKKEHDSKKSQEKKRMEQDKQKIRQKLGEELFDDVYLYLWTQRQQESTDEGQMFEHLKAMVGNHKRLLTEVFKLDGIVFKEILQEKGGVH